MTLLETAYRRARTGQRMPVPVIEPTPVKVVEVAAVEPPITVEPALEKEYICARCRGDFTPKKITIAKIQMTVCRLYNVSPDDLLSGTRRATMVRSRQIAMYLARTMTPHSTLVIGRCFGDRDHTTIMHAAKKWAIMSANDPAIANELEAVRLAVLEFSREEPT